MEVSPCRLVVGMTGAVLLSVAVIACGLGRASSGQPASAAAADRATSAAPRLARVWSLDDLAQPLRLPVGLAVDRHGDLYIVDAGHNRLQKYDRDGRFLTAWGGEGAASGQFRFRRPDRCDDRDGEDCVPDVGGGVAVDGDANVYVADYGNARIQVFDRHGRFRASWGSEGSGPGEFLLPRGIAVDGHGRVAVADAGNQRVQWFDRAGRFLSQWGRETLGVDQPLRPTALAVDQAGHLSVVDAGRGLARRFDRDGRQLGEWRWEVDGNVPDGVAEPAAGAAVDRDGYLYITSGDRLLMFDRNGTLLARWGRRGPGQGQLRRPTGVAVDRDGHLYVADHATSRVHKFRHLPPPKAAALGGGLGRPARPTRGLAGALMVGAGLPRIRPGSAYHEWERGGEGP